MALLSTASGHFRLQVICTLLGITGLFACAVSMFTSGMLIVVITIAGLLGFATTLVILVRRLKRLAPILRTVSLIVITVLAGLYLLLFGFITLFQDTVANETSSFFQPRSMSAERAQVLLASDVESVDITTPDGARLRGWLVRNTTQSSAPLLIYFDGSGSDPSSMIPLMKQLDGWQVALVNYRGFGLSEGTPSQAHTFADATLIYDRLGQQPEVDAHRIVAMGYSLGTGIAVYLAAQRPLAGTILVSPYDRLSLIGLKRPILYAPLMGIMKPYFDSISRAPGIRSPLLCLVGDSDTVVPADQSLMLASRWGGSVTVKVYEGEDHDLLLHHNSAWTDIRSFLDLVAQP